MTDDGDSCFSDSHIDSPKAFKTVSLPAPVCLAFRQSDTKVSKQRISRQSSPTVVYANADAHSNSVFNEMFDVNVP